MLKSKKAAIEVQFNWIFVLIAGALIIGFFVMIVSKQQTSVKSEINIVVSRAIEAILTGSKVSADSASPGSLPVGNIEFDCDSYSVGDVERKLKQMTVFAPDLIKGKQIITWSLPWNVPFRATNLLLLTSPQVRYIFVYDSTDLTNPLNAFADKLYNKMDEQLEFEKISANVDRIEDGDSVMNNNNYKVKFIYFANPVTNPLPSPTGVDVTAVLIHADNWAYDPDDG
ncbi:MAG: hypothetical protein QF632_03050, partial [Candidatus Woesearchaeota archaeon]|nr:hypothetical protein [Candidatus Woesearchaeota archaeon]